MELLAAEVEEAVLEAHVLRLVGLLVGDVEGRHLRGRLHHELVRLDLDLARRQVGVDRVGSAELHLARHRDDALEVRLLDEAEEAARGMDDDLREAVVVAEVHEEDAAPWSRRRNIQPESLTVLPASLARSSLQVWVRYGCIYCLLKIGEYYTIFSHSAFGARGCAQFGPHSRAGLW